VSSITEINSIYRDKITANEFLRSCHSLGLKLFQLRGIVRLATVCCVGSKQVNDCFLFSQAIEHVVSKYKSKFDS
jgi:hypothetical protein